MSHKETLKHTIIVALLLCLVCSVLVSGAAVLLKDTQARNKEFARNRDVLAAAGLYDPEQHDKAYVEEAFAAFSVKLVDLATGKYLTGEDARRLGIDPANYDQRKAAKDPELGGLVPADEDIATIKRQAKYATVYVLEKDGAVDRVVLPVHGYGLWSTLYGFLAVEGDGNSILGLTFYQHGETPGLGGEVDNPRWKSQWPGKKIYRDDDDAVGITVTKGGQADLADPYEVDGLSGATLTTVGVDNLVKFWMGENGFSRYLARLQGGEA